MLQRLTAGHTIAGMVLKQQRAAGGERLIEISRNQRLKIRATAEPLRPD